MKFYLETIPSIINLKLLNKGSKKTKYLIITEEGIMDMGIKIIKE